MPTGNLDNKNALLVMEILKKLNRQGMTVVMVTHDTSLAEYGTRIIRVKDGSILSTCD